jgi:hypothetical protein
MMNTPLRGIIEQVCLFHDVYEDDQLLQKNPDAEWYSTLKNFPWEDYRQLGSQYYDALYHHNKLLEKTEASSPASPVPAALPEDKKDAAKRLLFNRPTMDKTQPVLYEPEFKSVSDPRIRPESIAPGVVPHRAGGPKPKCFFAMFKSFIGVSLMGFAPEPENVHLLLTSNLSFARVCGFIPNGSDEKYGFKDVPSLRKLEQFDQIMREYGLWNQAKWDGVRKNIDQKVIEKENIIVGDTTHYHAFSGFETVSYTDENGKEQKKSQSKPTKNCRCEDKETCPHPWELSDDGAGTIVKGSNKIIWGHKASVVGVPSQGIPLDARCVADASTHDGQTFLPHVTSLLQDLPEVKTWFETALYDSACDDPKLKEQFEKDLGIQLKTSMNPRRRKPITEDLPRGMEKLTPYGDLICRGGFDMNFKGIRQSTGTFIYQAPIGEEDRIVCADCEHRSGCCPLADNGRIVTIPFDKLPHINPEDPPMASRFKSIMKRRTSVERMIKRLKCDLGDDTLKKRGNASFQAYLDKTMIALHILLRQ